MLSFRSMRTFALPLLLAGLGACDGCGADDPGPATLLEGSGSTTGFAVFGAPDEPEAEPEDDAPPAPPSDIRHDAAPTADDVAITPVTGPWLAWRGAEHRSGVREVRAIRQPVIRWSKEVGIQGYRNTPIVRSDAIWVSSQGNLHHSPGGAPDERDGVYRLDPATGAQVWFYPTLTNASGLTFVDDTLIVGDETGRVHRIDAETGRARWVVETSCQVHFAPMVDGDRILLPRETGALVLSLADGRVLAEPENERCHNNHRAAFSRDGDEVWLGAHDAPFRRFSEGALTWQAPAPGAAQRARYFAYTPPLLTRSLAIGLYNQLRVTAPDGTDRFVLAVVAHWRDNGQVAWIIEIDRPEDQLVDTSIGQTVFNHALPLLVGTRLYLVPTNRGTIEAWDVLTGRRLETARFPDCRRRQFASPIAASDVAYVPRHDGVLYGVQLDPLRVVWSLPLGLHGAIGARETHEPIAGGCSARPVDGTALFAPPALAEDGTLYVGSGDGWLYAIADRDW